jgi:hypothetical protein
LRGNVANFTTGTTGTTVGATTATTTDGKHLKGRNTLRDNPASIGPELNNTVRTDAVGNAADWCRWTESVSGLSTSNLTTQYLTANEWSLWLLN